MIYPPRKICINRECKRKNSQFSYKVIVVAKIMKFLEVVTPPSIYQLCSGDTGGWWGLVVSDVTCSFQDYL